MTGDELGGGSILAVDDNPANLRLLTTMLSSQGYEVRVATSGAQALKTVSIRPPDLILLDVNMPGMDGIQVCQKLKADEASRMIPVIFISALTDTGIKIRGFKAGAVDYVTKPFASEEVLARVRTHLALNGLQNRLEQQVEQRTRELAQEIAERKSTEKKLAEYRDQLEIMVAKRTEELRNQQMFLNTVLENIEDGIVACDGHGSLILFNRATRNLHGIDQEDLPPKQWANHYRLFHLDGKTIMSTEEIPLYRAFQGEQVHEQYLVIEHVSGDKRIVICNGQPMYDKSGDKIGAVVSMHDVTEQLKFENELREARDIAEAANRAKSVFLANMSHELRTPMHAILSFTSLAEKKAENDKVVHYLENIHTSGIRLTKLLDDLLDLSKLESGKMDIEPNFFDLAEVARESITPLESLIGTKNLKVDTTELESASGTFDKKLIIQVITNIISNAIKFSPEDGNILVKTTSHEDSNGQYLQLSVTDEGVGIPENELDSIFDAFVQSTKTKTNTGGTGLGLPISKEIIELHHGKIWAESPVNGSNVGSVFYFSIPKDYVHHKVHEINKYIRSHNDWKMMIKMIMASEDKRKEIPVDTIENHHQCELGKWLDTEEPRHVFEHKDLELLEKNHKLFHSLAGNLIESYKESDLNNLDEDLKRFNRASMEVIKLLKKYK